MPFTHQISSRGTGCQNAIGSRPGQPIVPRLKRNLLRSCRRQSRTPRQMQKNIFAVGFSNGGYWASFLAARKHVNAAASHYGVWRWPSSSGWDGYPVKYFETDSHPVLALHGDRDSIQKPSFVYPQLEAAKARSPFFSHHIFSDAGHSWDCERCLQDGFDRAVSQKALEMTLDFFAENRR